MEQNYNILISYGLFLNKILNEEKEYMWKGRIITYNFTILKIILKEKRIFNDLNFFDLRYLNFLHQYNSDNKDFEMTLSNLPGYKLENELDKKTEMQHFFLTNTYVSIKNLIDDLDRDAILNETLDESFLSFSNFDIFYKYKDKIINIDNQLSLLFKNGVYSLNNKCIYFIDNEDIEVKTKNKTLYQNNLNINQSLQYDKELIDIINSFVEKNYNKRAYKNNKSQLFKFLNEKKSDYKKMKKEDVEELLLLEFLI